MKNFYILLFILFGIKTFAQEFYITSYDYNTFLNTIKYVDADLNVTPLATYYFNGDQILDIAMDANGTLYGTKADTLIELNLVDGTSTEVYNFPVPGQYNSLVCNSDNQIVALDFNSQRLITIDLATFTQVSNVYLSESSPGDLTYYKGNLLFPSASSDDIMSYNGNTVTPVGCRISSPSGEPFLFWGYSNFTDSCDTNFVYGFNQSGTVYSFDIESNTHEYVGNLQENNSWPLNGATSINEYTASACPLVPLNAVNCNLAVSDYQLSLVSFYPNPVEDIIHLKNLNVDEPLFISIFSVEGRKLTDALLTPEMDISKLPSGLYFMEISNQSKSISATKKIIKK